MVLLAVCIDMLVNEVGHLAEGGNLLALIERSDLLHDDGDKVLSEEQWITTTGP